MWLRYVIARLASSCGSYWVSLAESVVNNVYDLKQSSFDIQLAKPIISPRFNLKIYLVQQPNMLNGR